MSFLKQSAFRKQLHPSEFFKRMCFICQQKSTHILLLGTQKATPKADSACRFIYFQSLTNIWLCLTRTGNYQIHEFVWLKSILMRSTFSNLDWYPDRYYFAVKKLRLKRKIIGYFHLIYGSAKKPDEKKKVETTRKLWKN